jgi:hypothetical protein
VTRRPAPVERPRRRTHHRRDAGALLLLAFVLALPIGPAAGQTGPSDGPSYGARAVDHAERPVSGLTFVHALEAGTSTQDAVEIINYTGQPASFDLYGADYLPMEGGGTAPAPREDERTGAGAWIAPSVPTIEVPPRSLEVVPFTIDVPAGVLPGDHALALLVEPVPAPTAEMVVHRTRTALRVQVEVLGEIDLGVGLGPLDWRRDGRAVTFALPVTNTGNVTFAANGAVVIRRGDEDPVVELPLRASERALGPEATASLDARWDEAPWFGRVTAQAVVDADVGDRPPRQFVGDETVIWLVPWVHVLAGAAMLAVLAALVLATQDPRHRRRERRRAERELLREFREHWTPEGEPTEPSRAGSGHP